MKWKDPTLSLGERCVAFSENEMQNGVKEDKPNSFTSPRIREYLAPCRRRGSEALLGLKAGNYCAASVCFALQESLLPEETPPHGYRAGVVEVVADMQEKGLWHSIASVRNGQYRPKKGDVVVFDRSNPANPSTSWQRHIARFYDEDGQGNFRTIDGNSDGGWKINNHSFTKSPKLLGFGEYPVLQVQAEPVNQPTEVSEEHQVVSHYAFVPSKKDYRAEIAKPSIWDIILNFLQSFFKK